MNDPISGNLWDGILNIIKSPTLSSVSLFVILYTTISTFLYFHQAHIISEVISESESRTAYFSFRDLTVNVLTVTLQLFITEKILRRWGLIFGLILVPIVAGIGFLGLGITQSIYVLFVLQVAYRALNFSVQKPIRETLFTSLRVSEKYRSKNFVDTTIYRGGDAAGGWIFSLLSSFLPLAAISFITVGLATLWGWTGYNAGRTSVRNTRTLKHEKNEKFILEKKCA